MFAILAQVMRYGNQSGAATRPSSGTGVRSMMGWAGNNPTAVFLNDLLGLITWILIIAVLFALLRVLWKKGDKVK